MNVPAFNDRCERKYQIGIDENEVADLWRDLKAFLGEHKLVPVQEITSVGSVYFDNEDCDLLRLSLLGQLMIFRIRAYELFGESPLPISNYWVEVKTADGERRHKKRFPLTKQGLLGFLAGKDAEEGVFDIDQTYFDDGLAADYYKESQETLLGMGLSPILLVTCKRLAFQGEVDRLSLDWDVRYYDARSQPFDDTSWKYLDELAVGKAEKIILELKYLKGEPPAWFSELEKRYPIRRREYLKPVEGMGSLFRGPVSEHKEANRLLPMIDSYMANSLLG